MRKTHKKIALSIAVVSVLGAGVGLNAAQVGNTTAANNANGLNVGTGTGYTYATTEVNPGVAGTNLDYTLTLDGASSFNGTGYVDGVVVNGATTATAGASLTGNPLLVADDEIFADLSINADGTTSYAGTLATVNLGDANNPFNVKQIQGRMNSLTINAQGRNVVFGDREGAGAGVTAPEAFIGTFSLNNPTTSAELAGTANVLAGIHTGTGGTQTTIRDASVAAQKDQQGNYINKAGYAFTVNAANVSFSSESFTRNNTAGATNGAVTNISNNVNVTPSITVTQKAVFNLDEGNGKSNGTLSLVGGDLNVISGDFAGAKEVSTNFVANQGTNGFTSSNQDYLANYQGNLQVNGNFVSRAVRNYAQAGAPSASVNNNIFLVGSGNFHVSGTATITDTDFTYLVDNNYANLNNKGFLLISTGGGFTNKNTLATYDTYGSEVTRDGNSVDSRAIVALSDLIPTEANLRVTNRDTQVDGQTLTIYGVTATEYNTALTTLGLDGRAQTNDDNSAGLYEGRTYIGTNFSVAKSPLQNAYGQYTQGLEIFQEKLVIDGNNLYASAELDEKARGDMAKVIKQHSIELREKAASEMLRKLNEVNAALGYTTALTQVDVEAGIYQTGTAVANSLSTAGVALTTAQQEQKTTLESAKSAYVTLYKALLGEAERLSKLNAEQFLPGGSGRSEEGQIFNALTNTPNNGYASAVISNYLLGAAPGSANFGQNSGVKAVNEIRDNSKETAGNSALNNPLSVINLSNDMSIASRFAVASNPYGNYAANKELSKMRFAAAGNPYGQYGSNFANNFWANAFGGVAKLNDNGHIYGISLGYDRLVNDSTLLGAYLTYADSELSASATTRQADNLQVGVYSRTYLGANSNHELDFRAYGQFSAVDQDTTLLGQRNSANFDQKFFGVSGGYGYVFDLNNGLFIKPGAGLNFYYAYTPGYQEHGQGLNRDVRSFESFNTSLEISADVRKYFSDRTYVYVTPKLEQYIAGKEDNYTARFVGGSQVFHVDGGNKDKLYGQLIVGGEFGFANNFAATVSVGAKQLFSGKVSGQDETYYSGNLGLKYSF